MNYPQLDAIQKYTGGKIEETDASMVFKMINDCIEYIWDGEEIYKSKDATKKELDDFVESLNTTQFTKIRDYFEGMPRLRHTVKWTCPKCEVSTPVVLEGIDAFFE